MERYKTTNDIMNASHEDLIDYALEVTAERNALKAENAELHKSDASKEQSSIDYYCKFRKLKDENKELKARLEKAVELPMITPSPYQESNIFMVYARVGNGAIVCEPFKTREAAEARLKELRGEE